jgi:hypothetical protein
MQTKLTLRLEGDLIERAKGYAERAGKSVSQLVADYFEMLPPEEGKGTVRLTPIVQSLLGVLKGAEVSEEDYRRHLEEKYR